MNDTNTPEIINGPARKTMYVAALYFTMTCMTSVCLSILKCLLTHYTHRHTHIQMGTKASISTSINHIFGILFIFFPPCILVALHLYECFQWDIDGRKKKEIHNTNLSTLAITVEICIQKIILNDHLGEENKNKNRFLHYTTNK